jgi:hypothetical protein
MTQIGPAPLQRVSEPPARFSKSRAIRRQCEEGDLNPYFFRNQILSLARLPVPPSSREGPQYLRLRGALVYFRGGACVGASGPLIAWWFSSAARCRCREDAGLSAGPPDGIAVCSLMMIVMRRLSRGVQGCSSCTPGRVALVLGMSMVIHGGSHRQQSPRNGSGSGTADAQGRRRWSLAEILSEHLFNDPLQKRR